MTVFWTIFLIAPLIIFAFAEGYALKTNKPTLSRYVWTVSAKWPPFPFFIGFTVGFLACHFWWGGIVSFSPVQ